ncbi:MAG: hypothetical protein D6744_08150 [Planctomycetota bacterium]|nr:MAG: hypothetical protein D6744_08150 [Planctomycetota bacterium]
MRYQESPWSYGQSPGTKLITEHYAIFTTLQDPRLVRALPQALETAYHYYRTLIPTAGEPAEPMPVYLFSRRGEFEHYTRRRFPSKARLLTRVRNGGYMEAGSTVIEYTSHGSTFPLMTHEAFHQFLYFCVKSKVPPWLNEGLSTMCEGQRWGSAGLREFDPLHNPTRRNRLAEALLEGDMIPLRELLRIGAGDVIGKSPQKAYVYYAELWGLMLFLQHGADGKYAASFARLLDAVGRENLETYARAAHVTSSARRYNFGRAVFESFISPDIDEVEREFRAYLGRLLLNEPEETGRP